jgi:hypothetical protein
VARSDLVRAPLAVLAALLLCATRGLGAPLRVALTMEEPAGVGRDAEPVTVGIPLPAGAVRDAGTLWVADAGGRRVATQARALSGGGRVRAPRRRLASVGPRDGHHTLRQGPGLRQRPSDRRCARPA